MSIPTPSSLPSSRPPGLALILSLSHLILHLHFIVSNHPRQPSNSDINFLSDISHLSRSSSTHRYFIPVNPNSGSDVCKELAYNCNSRPLCFPDASFTSDLILHFFFSLGDALTEPLAIVEGYNSYFSFSRNRSGYSGNGAFCGL